MSKYDKLLLNVLRGKSDTNIDFDDICKLLHWLGFDERTRGSHHIFRKEGIEEKINLQRDGKLAKAYQIRQVRSVILHHHLGNNDEH